MIESIRTQFQKKGSKIILWIMILGFAGSSFIGIINYSRRFSPTSIATVNGDQEIEIKEFQRQYVNVNQQIQYIRQLFGSGADGFLKQLGFSKKPEELALESLVFQKAEQSAAHRVGGQVNREYIQAKLRDPYFVREFLSEVIPQHVIKNGIIDIPALQSLLQDERMSEDELEEMIANILERVLFRRLIAGAEYVPIAELKEAYEAEFLKKKYGIVTLSLETYLKKAETEKLSEDAIKQYFDAHKEDYRIAEKRSGLVWTFDPESYGIGVEEKNIRDSYNKRRRSFIEKPEEYEVQHILLKFDEKSKNDVRRQGQELVKQIKEKPESFAELATKYSQAKEKAQPISVKKGEKGPAFEQFVFSLTPNEVSPVFETADGFEIVKLIRIQEPVYKSFDQVKDQLTKTFKQESFDREFSAAVQRVLKQSADLPTVFSTFIKDKKGQESKIENLQEGQGLKAQKLFGLKKNGERAFLQEGGKGFVVELTSITPSTLPELTAVKQQVVKDLYTQKARSALEADIASLTSLLKKDNAKPVDMALLADWVKDKKEALAKGAAAIKANYLTTGWVEETSSKFAENSIPLDKIKELRRVQDVVSGITEKNGFIVELVEKEPFVEKDFNEKKNVLRLQIAQKQEKELVGSVLDALKKKATVVYHNDRLNFKASQ
ncbi:peptidylprolyl isomerase [Candidatus Dependentiae bacterium]|nr:peptidylprolyl isomerase [Candidatus Dependentiae bacterium]